MALRGSKYTASPPPHCTVCGQVSANDEAPRCESCGILLGELERQYCQACLRWLRLRRALDRFAAA